MYCTWIDLYCRRHDTSLCLRCLKDAHSDCPGQEIDAFNDVVENIKFSAKFESIEKKAEDLKSDFFTLSSYCNEIIEHIDRQMLACRNEIKDARKRINGHFDNLEVNLEKICVVRRNEIERKIRWFQERVQ